MKRHWAYFKYLARHKWFVAVAGHRLGLSFWRLLIHDWHKFLPGEWFPYAETFYKTSGAAQYAPGDGFAMAWNLHQKRGRHHWQHWLITWDRGETEPLMMQGDYAVEMVADWLGAGRAITGKWGASSWYRENSSRMILHPITRMIVEDLLKSEVVQDMERNI